MDRTGCPALRFAAMARATERAGAAIDVAVAVVRDVQGRVLLAQRTARQVSAGFWELPGGKIDAGESAAQAAVRELREETGLEAAAVIPWKVYEHAFPTKRVRLHLFRVEGWRGQPHGREGQRLAWVDPAAPAVGPLLPSNLRALTVLGLPAVLHEAEVARGDGGAGLLGGWPALAARGARWLLLRAPGLAPAQRTLLVQRLRERCRRAGLTAPAVLLAGSALEALRAGCAGIHSGAPADGALPSRPPVALWTVDGADADSADRARAAGADALIVPPTDPQALQRIARRVALPVYLRATDRGDLGRAQACGAAGIALAVTAVTASDDREAA